MGSYDRVKAEAPELIDLAERLVGEGWEVLVADIDGRLRLVVGKGGDDGKTEKGVVASAEVAAIQQPGATEPVERD